MGLKNGRAMILDDMWTGIEGTNNEIPFLMRVRENLQKFSSSNLYPNRIDICWTYNSSDESLMPDDTDIDLMAKVEDVLVRQLERDQQSILAFVYTGNNQRVWYWYTRNIDEAGKRINGVLLKFEKLPIELFSSFDPEWDEYNSVID